VGLGADGEGYLLADLSCRLSPDGWARRAVAAYEAWGADRIIGEVNMGGDLVAATIRTIEPRIPFRAVHATRGKFVRAEPIAALYEQSRIHHVGTFPELEDQMCSFTNDKIAGRLDDRVDAAVWGFSDLMLEPPRPSHLDFMEMEVKAAGRWEYYLELKRQQEAREAIEARKKQEQEQQLAQRGAQGQKLNTLYLSCPPTRRHS
jgi:hypothetical protein